VKLTDLGVTGVNRLKLSRCPHREKGARCHHGHPWSEVKEKEALIARFQPALNQPGNLDNGATSS
jgi:hypothetical protein